MWHNRLRKRGNSMVEITVVTKDKMEGKVKQKPIYYYNEFPGIQKAKEFLRCEDVDTVQVMDCDTGEILLYGFDQKPKWIAGYGEVDW